MPEPVNANIDERSLALFNQVTNQSLDGSTVAKLIGNPDWDKGESISDWRFWVDPIMRQGWRTLGWEARVTIYLVAEDSARFQRSALSFDEERNFPV